MNCNCCNCSNNNSCDESSKEIKIFGTLKNVTLDANLKDDRDAKHDACKADNWPSDISEEGHNAAIAYAYQLHDGRFRQSDENMAEWERFLDEINKRVTDIVYAEKGGPDGEDITIIENPYTHDEDGNLVPIGDCNCDPYDDQWIKDTIGATPSNFISRKRALNEVSLYPNDNDEPVHADNIIDFILNLAAEVNKLRNQSGSGKCYWKEDEEGYLEPNEDVMEHPCAGVKGPGFYDTKLQ